MAETKISQREQRCISECVFKHWGSGREGDSGERDQKYEQCLTDCNICS